jgi:hypothetical protein
MMRQLAKLEEHTIAVLAVTEVLVCSVHSAKRTESRYKIDITQAGATKGKVSGTKVTVTDLLLGPQSVIFFACLPRHLPRHHQFQRSHQMAQTLHLAVLAQLEACLFCKMLQAAV